MTERVQLIADFRAGNLRFAQFGWTTPPDRVNVRAAQYYVCARDYYLVPVQPMPTFAELFCERHRVRPDDFVHVVFRRCLHRRTWVCVPLLRLLRRDYFAADYELIRDVGRLTHARGLGNDLADYYSHPGNIGFLRRRLKLRLSIGRVTRLVHSVLASERSRGVAGGETRKPFNG